MELDLWNDDLLAGDWSLSLPVDRSGGLFGDLKSEGCLCGDDPLSLQLQDAVERVRSETPSRNEGIFLLNFIFRVFSKVLSFHALDCNLIHFPLVAKVRSKFHICGKG